MESYHAKGTGDTNKMGALDYSLNANISHVCCIFMFLRELSK